jgi:FixJ family two-component response regulator
VSKETVFVIDDDASVRRALQRLIQTADYHVETLDRGMAYLGHPPPVPPACLVLDIRMPDMGGLDLQQLIRGTPHALPIVFITGHGDQDARETALAEGAVDVLSKPLDDEVLLDAIARALERSRRH